MLISATTMAPPQAGNDPPCLVAGQEGDHQDLSSSSCSSDLQQSSNQLHSLPLHIQIQESKGSLHHSASASASAFPICTSGAERGRRQDFRIFRDEPVSFCSSSSSSSSLRQSPVQSTINIKKLESNSEDDNVQLRNRIEPHCPSGDDGEHCDADCEASLNDTHTQSSTRKNRCSISKTKKQRRRKLNSGLSTCSLNESKPSHCHDVLIRKDCVSPLAAVSSAVMAQRTMTNVQEYFAATMEKDLNYNSSNSINSLLLHTEHPATNGREFISSRYNAWDSSPSTVCDDDEHDTNASLDFYFHPIQDKNIIFGEGSNIQKALFDTKDEDDNSIIPENTSEKALEITDESDLELTQRSRQIQMDLRVREMLELAQEAERAAEEGREKFVGSATKFELGLGLDVGNNRIDYDGSPDRKMSPAKGNVCSLIDGLQCNRQNSEAVTPLAGGNSLARARSQYYSYYTDVKKVPDTKRYFRQNSAPATVMARTVRARSHNIPRLLTNGNIFSIAPTNQIKHQAISVLELRHIDEVIPTFKDMHSFMKMNFVRKGVKEENLAGILLTDVKQEDDLNERVVSKRRQDSRTILRQSSIISSVPMTFLPRVPSINMIMKTMSGLSSKEPEKAEDLTKSKSLDDASKMDTKASDDGADTDLSVDPDDMPLDCVSFVSCGDVSVGAVSSAENSVVKTTCTASSVADEHKFDEVSNKFETHGSTLASELYNPSQRRRSISPLPKAPYCLDDDCVELTPKRNCTASKSRWSDFWENISPVRKSISLPSPIRLQFPNSLDYKGGSWMLPNEILGTRKLSFKRLSSIEQSLHFDAVDNREGIDEPLEIEKDDLNNGVIISSQSYSQTILRSTSPINDHHNNGGEASNGGENVCLPESISLNANSHNTDERCICDNIKLDKEGVLLCKQHCSKRSFRTSTTQMSGEDSQSSSGSKLSCCSLQTGISNSDKVENKSLILTVRQIDDHNASTQIYRGPNLESSNHLLRTNNFDKLLEKPPLHPADTQNVQAFNETMLKSSTSSSTDAGKKAELLQALEASISFRNFTETSSDLSINSENEGAEIYREITHIRDSRDQDLTKVTSTETNLKDQKILFDGDDDDSSVASPEELNKSMSFIDLIEKVPSVIGRFRPFRIIKKDNIEFKNDVDYVRNYFFTQLEQNSCRIHVDSNLTVKPDDTNKCGTHPCMDLNCVSVIETAFRCLSSTHNISMDAHDRNRSGLAYFPNKKYGNLNSSGMREKVRVGHLLFEAPSLKVFKKVHRNAK